jgi:hypothetical protein
MTYQFICTFIVLCCLSLFIETQDILGANPAFLKVIVLVNNTGGGTAQPSDFSVWIDDPAEPNSFVGLIKGTIVLAGPGTHEISINDIIINNVPYALEFSGNCVGIGLQTGEVVIKPGDKKTCIITASYPNFE